MLLFLSIILGMGIIIPGFLKIREFEFNEAEIYLRDRNTLLHQEILRSKEVLKDAGVMDIESYVSASKQKLIERYQEGEADKRISTFIINEDGQALLTQQGLQALALSSSLRESIASSDSEFIEFNAGTEPWRVISNHEKDWGWSVVTAIAETEIYRDSNAYLRFVLFVSSGVLLAVLLVYMTLTRQIRRRFSSIIEGIKEYKLGQSAPVTETFAPDEIGLLQRHIHTMMDGISQEMRARKETESALEAAKIEAENANRAKSEFLANMSHEIRNPLNSVIGFSELLSKTDMNQEQKEYLKYLMHASSNLTATINDILDLSKIEYGIVEIVPEHFNFAEDVRKTFGLYLPQAKNKGLEMKCNIDGSVPEQIYGDRARCSEIVSNLLSNAIKYTNQGQITLDMNLDHQNETLHVLRICVSDTGIGISEEEEKTIFRAFSQANVDGNSDKQLGKGVGLGLAIVRRLLNLMGGSIDLESEPGKGSKFSVIIPFEKHTAQESVIFDVPAPESHPKSGLLALVADDDFLNQKYVEQILNQNGIETVLASDGKQALDRILAQEFDILLLDIRMPEMTGVEVMEYVRTQLPSPAKHTPIIALTANAYESDIKRYLDAGATSYMSKPYSAEELLNTIHTAIDSVAA